MPYSETTHYLVGTYNYGPGQVYPNGKNYVNRVSWSSPEKESRPRPADTSAFSLSGTSRTYYTKNVAFSTMGQKPMAYPPGAIERIPVGWIGGGANIPAPALPVNYQTRILLKIKDQRANLGITLAQYRQLTTLFTGITGDIVNTAKAIRSLRNPYNWGRLYRNKKIAPAVKRILGSGAKVHLGYIFGVSQFVDDFRAVSYALQRRFEDPMYLEDHLSYNLTDEATATGGSSSERWVSQVNWIVNHHFRYRYRVYPNDQVLSQMGMTLESAPSLLYDAVPFSFVLNWIIPLGKYLAALDALTGVDDLRWFFTVKTNFQRWNDYPAYSGHLVTTSETLARSQIQTNLVNRFVGYQPSRSAKNVLTALSLLAALRRTTPTNAIVLTR